MLNSVNLIGRITNDPEVKKTQNGTSVLKFTLAVQYNNDHTDFIRCEAWKTTADYIGNYIRKGNLMSVEGKITTGEYEGQNGKVYTTTVTCQRVQSLTPKTSSSEPNSAPNERRDNGADATLDIDADDLPFY